MRKIDAIEKQIMHQIKVMHYIGAIIGGHYKVSKEQQNSGVVGK